MTPDQTKIDPMTVVLTVSGGVLTDVFSDLPITTVLVDYDNEDVMTGVRANVRPLRDLSDEDRERTLNEVSPLWQLSTEQVRQIRQLLFGRTLADVGDATKLKAVVRQYVDGLPVVNAVRAVGVATITASLGFDPHTGKPPEPEPAAVGPEAEKPKIYQWMRSAVTQTWHIVDPATVQAVKAGRDARYSARTVCESEIESLTLPTPMIQNDKPEPSSGVEVCTACVLNASQASYFGKE